MSKSDVILTALVVALLVVFASNRQWIPVVNPGRGFTLPKFGA